MRCCTAAQIASWWNLMLTWGALSSAPSPVHSPLTRGCLFRTLSCSNRRDPLLRTLSCALTRGTLSSAPFREMKRAGDFTTPGNNEAALAAAKASGAPVDAFLSTNEVSEASKASM